MAQLVTSIEQDLIRPNFSDLLKSAVHGMATVSPLFETLLARKEVKNQSADLAKQYAKADKANTADTIREIPKEFLKESGWLITKTELLKSIMFVAAMDIIMLIKLSPLSHEHWTDEGTIGAVIGGLVVIETLLSKFEEKVAFPESKAAVEKTKGSLSRYQKDLPLPTLPS